MSDERDDRADPSPDSTEMAPTEAVGAEEAADNTIGPYRLLQRLGEGGMGDVWLAEQQRPVRRKVALKVIKRGMDSKQVIGRFEAERQALALMDHPAVAKVFDVGMTPRGRSYFVMEYVKGVPITEACDRHKLSPLAMEAEFELAWSLIRQGTREQREQARDLLRRYIEVQTPRFGRESREILNARMSLADTRRMLGERREAEAELREIIPLMRRELEPDDPLLYYAINDLALTIDLADEDPAEAERLFHEAIAGIGRVLGPEHFETLNMETNLVRCLRQQGREEEFVQLAAEVIDRARVGLGEEAYFTVEIFYEMARGLRDFGRPQEALPYFRQALNIARRTRAHDPAMVRQSFRLATGMMMAGFHDEAEREKLALVDLLEGSRDPALDSTYAVTLYNLGVIAGARGDRGRGLDFLRRAVKAGWSDADTMAADPDLEPLGGPELDAIVRRLRAASR